MIGSPLDALNETRRSDWRAFLNVVVEWSRPVKTIYIVTAGDYSDYHVVSAHETRAEAEIVAAAAQDGSDIEEWPVGSVVSDGGMVRFRVTRHVPFSGEEQHAWWNAEVSHTDLSEWCALDNYSVGCVVLARDRDHALKIGSEYWRKWVVSQDIGIGSPLGVRV